MNTSLVPFFNRADRRVFHKIEGLLIARSPLSSHRFAYSVLEILVVIATITILVGILVPAIQRVRAQAARIACTNNLKQIGLALHNYHALHGSLPPGCSYLSGSDRQPLMSWLTRLLPYLENERVWSQAIEAYDRDKWFKALPHRPILSMRMPIFLCPADPKSQQPFDFGDGFVAAFTDYLGVEGKNLYSGDGVLYLDSKVRLSDIRDGTSNTLAAGERPPSFDNIYGWWYAGQGQNDTGSTDMTLGVKELCLQPQYSMCEFGSFSFQNGNANDPCSMFHYWSMHSGGANFVFVDGSVRFLAYKVVDLMPALASRAGGETTDGVF
jgi:prepilin-type processing-associated H-X9-DG protein